MADNGNIVKQNIKDSVFTDLFKIKKNIVELYKTLHPDDESVNENDITNVTVENIFTNTFYNDLGFQIKDKQIILMEAQSTWSVNILVRILTYLVQTYSRYIDETKQNVYNEKKINIPEPELYVLYTGERSQKPEYLSLCEEFFNGKKSSVEVKVKVLYGGDKEDNDIITQYVQFTKIYNEQLKKYGRTKKTIDETIRICRDRDILAEYLKSKKKEVENMMFTLFDQEKATEMYIRDVVNDKKEEMKKEIGEEMKKEIGEEMKEEGKMIVAIECVENVMKEYQVNLESACKVANITVEQYHSYKEKMRKKGVN